MKARETAFKFQSSTGRFHKNSPGFADREIEEMKMVIIFPHLVMRGGALNYTLNTAERLASLGNEVVIVTLNHSPDAIQLPSNLSIMSIDGPLTSDMGFWLRFPYWQGRLSKAVEEENPDLVLTHVFPANWWGWLYKRKHPQCKLIWMCHEPSAFIHSKDWIKALKPAWKSLLARITAIPFSVIDRSLSSYSDAVVANSRFTAEACYSIYGIKADDIVYPAIDTSVFYPRSEKKKGRLLSVGHLSKFKNVDLLLKAFAIAQKKSPDLEYWIVGNGEYKPSLVSLARDLGLEGKVHWKEDLPVEELAVVYSEASLLMHGAVKEPFGMVPLEALACGTPVLAHASGGPLEIVTSSLAGKLLGSTDPKEWADAILGLTSNFCPKNKVSEMAQSFSWDISAEKLNQVIKKIKTRV